MPTPASSVAVQVTLWDVPTTQDSPPLGAVRVTLGAVLSMFTSAAVPTPVGCLELSQVRSVQPSTVTVSTALAAALDTSTLKSVAPVLVEPHGSPITAPSALYSPPPRLLTWKLVVRPPPERKSPSVMLPAPDGSARCAETRKVTLNAIASVEPLRATLTGTVTVGWLGESVLAGEAALATAAGSFTMNVTRIVWAAVTLWKVYGLLAVTSVPSTTRLSTW